MSVITVCDIGINHNADIEIAKKLIAVAASAGVDYVKFQKRNPDLCTPENMKDIIRETPWGQMTYLDYRWKMEFGKSQYDELARHCKTRGIKFFFSVWDKSSVPFVYRYDCDFIKIPSACITDDGTTAEVARTGTTVILSTGMSDLKIISNAVQWIETLGNLRWLLHCISTYPSKVEEQNMNAIMEMKKLYPGYKIGFSNHYPGIIFIPIAVALGAEMVEWHITLDRSMWGTDQPASIEPEGTFKIVKYIRNIEKAMGDGEKRIFDSEIPIIQKLRRYQYV